MLARRLYLDNAATSFPKPKAVFEAMAHFAAELGASAGRGAYQEAMETGALVAQCRQRICTLFNGERPEQFVFTSNCTDGLNLAIKGLIDPRVGGHAICTAIDHNSILRPINAMVDFGWIGRTCVRIDPITGLVDPQEIARAIRPDTRLIAITHVSNVTGTIQPIREIGAIARAHDIPLVVDAAQSAGHVPIDVRADNVDLLAAPGHKGLLGPLGTGFLYIRPGLEPRVRPLREGGTGSISEQDRQPDFMPDRYESGSHNAIGLIGLSEGVAWVLEQGVENLFAAEKDMIRTFFDGVWEVEGLRFFGPQTIRNRLGVFSVRVEGYSPSELAKALEEQFGILTRAGIHCAPLAHQAIGTTEGGGTTRLSFGPFLSLPDVQYACDALAQIAQSKHLAMTGRNR